MENLSKRYDILESDTKEKLKNLIKTRGKESRHGHIKSIPVNVFDYTELSVVNDELVFLDAKGYHYSLYADASLEDLIEICESFN